MVFQLRVCVLRESSCFGLVSGFFICPWKRRGEGIKFDMKLWVHIIVVISFIVGGTSRRLKERVIRKNPGRQPYSSKDFLLLVHLYYKTSYLLIILKCGSFPA